jgi:hypothetical protein
MLYHILRAPVRYQEAPKLASSSDTDGLGIQVLTDNHLSTVGESDINSSYYYFTSSVFFWRSPVEGCIIRTVMTQMEKHAPHNNNSYTVGPSYIIVIARLDAIGQKHIIGRSRV